MGNILVKRFVNIICRYFLKSDSSPKSILLIPPTTLNGSFGDEIMCISFIENNLDKQITVYQTGAQERKDLFARFKNVNFLNSDSVINWSKYNKLVVLGADNMTGSYGVKNPLKKFKLLELANKFGLETSILGFSIKPNMPDIIIKRFRDISKFSNLYFRDVDSYELALKLKFENAIQAADLAFLTKFEVVSDEEFENWVTKNSSKTIIAFCPNALQAQKIGLDKYISNFANAISVLDKDLFAVIFLYHDLRKHCGDLSDKNISKMIFDKTSFKNKFFANNVQNGIQMKYYINFANYTFTGRMHFGISGLSVGIPMLGVTYEDKFSGLQKLFGINPSESLISDYENLYNYNELILRFLTQDNYKQSVDKNLDFVKDLGRKNFN